MLVDFARHLIVPETDEDADAVLALLIPGALSAQATSTVARPVTPDERSAARPAGNGGAR